MTSEDILKNCNSKMKKTFEVFGQDLASLRTGRANAAMLDIIKVDVYGQKMSINQLATISTPEARLLTVQVWDGNNVSLIDSAIRKSNLGINIYEFDYIDKSYGDGRYRGVMAQEVLWASIKDSDGYYMVDYSKVDVPFEKIN